MALESLKMTTDGVERKLVSYFLNGHLEKLTTINQHCFSNTLYKLIITQLPHSIKGGEISLDLLVEYLQRSQIVPKEDLIKIKEENPDIKEYEATVELLNEFYFKNKTIDELSSLAIKVSGKDRLNFDDIKTSISKINHCLVSSNNSKIILEGKDVGIAYEEVMKERAKGIIKKSYGLNALDEVMIRPAAPGEFSLIVGMSGSAKSTLLFNMLHSLSNKHQPIIYFNLEMELDATMDRRLSIRRGVPIEDLIKQRKPDEVQRIVDEEIKSIMTDKYSLYIQHPHITLDMYDEIMYQAKERFYALGVLPKDEYIVVGFDLFTMLADFSKKAQWNEYEGIVNRFHDINRKHRCHPICLIQANENKLRSGKGFKRLTDLEYFQVNLEDIKGGSVFKERARAVFAINRPKQLKERYFPELKAEYELEPDILHLNLIKTNHEKHHFHWKFILDDYFRIIPFVEHGEVL